MKRPWRRRSCPGCSRPFTLSPCLFISVSVWVSGRACGQQGCGGVMAFWPRPRPSSLLAFTTQGRFIPFISVSRIQLIPSLVIRAPGREEADNELVSAPGSARGRQPLVCFSRLCSHCLRSSTCTLHGAGGRAHGLVTPLPCVPVQARSPLACRVLTRHLPLPCLHRALAWSHQSALSSRLCRGHVMRVPSMLSGGRSFARSQGHLVLQAHDCD